MIKVKTDYEGSHYITANKEYEVTWQSDNGFKIVGDNGSGIYCLWEKCVHIDEHDWQIVGEGNDVYLKCVDVREQTNLFTVGKLYKVIEQINGDRYLIEDDGGEEYAAPLYGRLWKFEVVNVLEPFAPNSPEMDIIWDIINGSEQYNGHSQLTISQMKLEHLLDLVKSLDGYVDNFCDLRISHFSQDGCYTACLHEVSDKVDGKDRLLLGVDKIIM